MFATSRRRFENAALTGYLLAGLHLGTTLGAQAQEPLPDVVPDGVTLVVADQNEALQTLIHASGVEEQLDATVQFANFLGGPAIFEAFRAGALDLAVVGNTPPIQAHAAGATLPIVAALTSSSVDYHLAVRPGLTIDTLEGLAGKKLSYAEGTGRQPFILKAIRKAGLTPGDVEFVSLRAADMPDAVRAGQVDVAVLNEPHFSRYLSGFPGASALPDGEHDRLPRTLSYLYASSAALEDPGKSAAISQFVKAWIAANEWKHADPDAWVQAYYVDLQRLSPEDGRSIVAAEGKPVFPLLSDLVETQQGLIDIIYDAGDLPERLNAADEFDLRFDAVIAAARDR